jgi:Spy/CpxP family protein refolding chaperone
MLVSKQLVRTLTVCAVVCLMATSALAQPPGGQGGGRGGRGGGGRGFGGGFGGMGMGGMGMVDSMALLRNEKVQEDLKLEPEQGLEIQKIEDAAREAREARGGDFGNFRDLSEEERQERFAEMRKEMEKTRAENEEKINKVLTEDQQKRLSQISIQVRGASALMDEKVQEKLGMNDDQKAKLTEAQEKNMEAMGAAMQELGRDAEPEARREKMAELRKTSEENIMDVLTAEQKTTFEEMKGEKIELTMEDFRGRGGRGGGPGGPGGPGGGGRGGRGEGGGRRGGDREE